MTLPDLPPTDMPLTDAPLSNMLCFALYSAAHAIQAAYKPLLDAAGVTYPQYLVLTLLWGQNNQTVGQLGAALQLESNTLTPLLKRMEAAGLLRRERDKTDERQVRICLTDQGLAVQDKTRTIPDCIIAQSGLSVAAMTDLQSRIMALRDTLRRAPAAP